MALIARDDIRIRIEVEGEDAYPRLERRSDSLGKSTKGLGRRLSELGNVLTGIDSAANIAGRGLGALQRLMDQASGPVGLAIAFEQQFGQIQTLTDEAGAKLEAGLLELAERVPQTAGDITQAAYQAISAGIDPGQAVDFLSAASKTAVAGATDLTSAVDLLTTAVNAYKARGLEAGEAADALFATVRAGKTTIPELTANLGQAAPAAAQFGVSVQELGAATAVLTKQGLSTSEAMTRINALIKAIVAPAGGAAKRLKALGVEFGASALEAKGLAGILADIQEKTGGSSDALGTLFRRFEATQGLLGLLSGDMRTFRADLESISSAAGETARANAIMESTTQGAIDRFKALGEGVLRDIGNELLPVFNDGLADLSAWVDDNRDEIVAFARDAAEALIAIGKWAKEDGPTLLRAMAGAFVASKIHGAAVALGAFRAELALIGPAAAGASANVGQLLGAGLRSAPVVAGAVAGAVFLGQAIGEAIGEAMTAEYREQAKRMEAETRALRERMTRALRGQGVGSLEERGKREAGITSGALLPGTGDAFNQFGGVRDVSGAAPVAQQIKTLGVDRTSALVDETLADIGAAVGNLNARVADRERRLAELAAQYEAAGGAAAEAAGAAAFNLFDAADRQANAQGKSAAQIREAIEAVEQGLVQDVDKIAALRSASARLAQDAEAAFAGLASEGKGSSGPAPTKPTGPARPPSTFLSDALGSIGPAAQGAGFGASLGAGEAMLALTQQQEAMAERMRLADEANAERRALLIEDGTTRELALLQLRYDAEAEMARRAGQDVTLVTQLYANERSQILSDAAASQRQIWVDTGSDAVGALSAVLDAYQAVAGESAAIRSLQMWLTGLDYQGKAAGYIAESFAAGAKGNIPTAIGLGLAAVKAQAAAVMNFANAGKAGGGRGGGGGGGGSGGGGGGFTPRRSAADAVPSSARSDQPIEFKIALESRDGGPIFIDGNGRALGEALAPILNRAWNARGGRRAAIPRG